mgnify:CR=1 FL=1
MGDKSKKFFLKKIWGGGGVGGGGGGGGGVENKLVMEFDAFFNRNFNFSSIYRHNLKRGLLFPGLTSEQRFL